MNLFIIDGAAFVRQLLYDPENPLLFNNGFFVYFFSCSPFSTTCSGSDILGAQ